MLSVLARLFTHVFSTGISLTVIILHQHSRSTDQDRKRCFASNQFGKRTSCVLPKPLGKHRVQSPAGCAEGCKK